MDATFPRIPRPDPPLSGVLQWLARGKHHQTAGLSAWHWVRVQEGGDVPPCKQHA